MNNRNNRPWEVVELDTGMTVTPQYYIEEPHQPQLHDIIEMDDVEWEVVGIAYKCHRIIVTLFKS